MVNAFQFSRLPGIYFKNGIISELPSFIRQFGNSAVVVTGKKSFIGSKHAETLFHDFKKNSINYTVISIPFEPTPDIIDNAVKELRDEDFKVIVSIGGGSVLDAGKAISAMMKINDPVSDYLEVVGSKVHPGTKLPFVAIPTTSGTGSEATKNAVITRKGENGFKRSLRHDNFVPEIALIDPELTLDCPRDITAASGMDCFTQLTEAYLSSKANQYTDALALEGLKAIKSSLLTSYTDGRNIEARAGMSFAALTSGICLANAGLGAVHGFASSIGGMYEIPHGLVCGTLMASGNEINVRELRKKADSQPALKKYAILGGLFSDKKDMSDNYYTDSFIKFLHELTAELNLPGLSEYGVAKNQIGVICRNTDIKNNPVRLTLQDLEDILRPRVRD
jgi:alcohol dehydrogenase class IV